MTESQYKLAEYIKALFSEKRLIDNYNPKDLILLVVEDLKAISNTIKKIK